MVLMGSQIQRTFDMAFSVKIHVRKKSSSQG